MARVPLAWSNLTSDRGKFLLSALAIGFAVMLLFVQVGFYFSLMDSSILLIEKINADLVVTHELREYLSFPRNFPKLMLKRIESVPGVGSVESMSMDVNFTSLRKPDAGSSPEKGTGPRPQERFIRVLGVDPDAHILNLPELDPNSPKSRIAELRVPGQALFDTKTREEYGLQKAYDSQGPFGAELSGQNLQIVAPFTLGRDFTAEGNLLVSDTTFRQYLRYPYPFLDGEEIDLGLIRLEGPRYGNRLADRSKIQSVLEAIREKLKGLPLQVETVDSLGEREQSFWRNSTPVGQVLLLGLIMGVGVGAVICYQILSSGVSDRISEYATLRAIGYSNRYLAWVVGQEALILACVGFVPGLIAAYFLYGLMEWMTQLPLRFQMDRILLVFTGNVAMCAISAWFAVREAQKIDPAEVF